MVVNASPKADAVWQKIVDEARVIGQREPLLKGFLQESVLNCKSFAEGLGKLLCAKLSTPVVGSSALYQICLTAYKDDPSILDSAVLDFEAVVSRDPASSEYTIPFLYLKGTQALQAYRVGHYCWHHGRQDLARYLQSTISNVFAVDIHPAARIGRGIMFDHATGIVIGETAVVGDNVSILQDVTLGGTGKETGDRHPKVSDGVMIGAGAKVLGNIRIGEGAKIGAGSVVLSEVMPHTTVAGIPARVVGRPREAMPSLDMDQALDNKVPICTEGCGIICSKQI